MNVPRSRRARAVLIGACVGVVLVVAAGVLLGARSFQSENRQPNLVYGARFCSEAEPTRAERGCVPAPEAAMVYADVLSIDPDQNAMTVRITALLPAGQFDIGGLLVPQVLNVSGRDVATFEVGAGQVHTIEAPLDFAKLPHECCEDVIDTNTSNRVTSYPFDEYDADFSVTLRTDPTDGAASERVPVRVSLRYAAHGYRLDAAEEIPEQYVLHIERSDSTVFFSIFVMALMWALTIGIVAMAVILTYVRHDIGPGLLGFLAAILFAFPGIRSVLPGAPPLGSLNDYLAFFWCEGIVGITLLVLTVLFLSREVQGHRARA